MPGDDDDINVELSTKEGDKSHKSQTKEKPAERKVKLSIDNRKKGETTKNVKEVDTVHKNDEEEKAAKDEDEKKAKDKEVDSENDSEKGETSKGSGRPVKPKTSSSSFSLRLNIVMLQLIHAELVYRWIWFIYFSYRFLCIRFIQHSVYWFPGNKKESEENLKKTEKKLKESSKRLKDEGVK